MSRAAPRELVVRGLYRSVRNPMYVSVTLIVAGEIALTRSRALFAYGMIWFACANLFVLAYEEPTLRRRFGASYEGYCREVEHEQALAQQVTGIFLEIDAEERSRVGDLFGPAARVSTLFREITDGRYRSVGYDVEQDEIHVVQNNGKSLRATALSGGAFDQLYLAIRLGIAEKLLPTSKGFFIMDDPFIKADSSRLATLMETLRRFVRDGWQILYFSAKQEVLDALAPDIRAGDVRLVELNRTLFSAPLLHAPAGGRQVTPPQMG